MVSQLKKPTRAAQPPDASPHTSRPRQGSADAGLGTRARLVSAAALEFANRGFDGAKVDRIARRARVNKAMLYYHFDSKADLYRAILRDLFGSLALAVGKVRTKLDDPESRLTAFIGAVAEETAARPHFPALWLREMAEGGRHLDGEVVGEMGAVMRVLAGIIGDGVASGRFRPTHPLVVQMGIVAPLLLFDASAPARARLGALTPLAVADVARAHVLDHILTTTLSALRLPMSRKSPNTPRRSRT